MRIYTPVVKAKANDISALAMLSPYAKTLVKPLLEAPISIDRQLVETANARAVKALVDKMPSMPFYFDPLGIESTMRQVAAFNELAESGLAITPTIGFGRGAIDVEGLRKCLAAHTLGLCFRLEQADIDETSEATWTRILDLTAQLELNPRNVDLIIDLRKINQQSLPSLRELVTEFLALRPQSFRMGDFTIVATSALDSVAGIDLDGLGHVERRELSLWAAINYELGDGVGINFGDYGVLSPDFVFSGPNPNANAKIRYTVGKDIKYFRGHGLYRPSRFDQYHQLAQRVVDSGYFMGREFSYGDESIQRCSEASENPGNLATWIRVDTNHHVELTTRQISRMHDDLQAASNEKQIRELVAEL